MTKVLKRIENIIVELTRFQSLPLSEQCEEDDFPLPRMIGAGDGRQIIVSRKIDGEIENVAQTLLNNDLKRKRQFTQAEWRARVRRAFGSALVSIDLDEEVSINASIIWDGVNKYLKEDDAREGRREFAFGCSLFDNAGIKSFEIGPVRFEGRDKWLERKYREKAITAVSQRRIKRVWNGEKLSKRKSSRDSTNEAQVLAAVDSCQYVCSVTTNGLGNEAGREKALMAARLATTVIALIWRTPSKALDGINLFFDRETRRQTYLVFAPDGGMGAGSNLSSLPNSPTINPEFWESVVSKWSVRFAVVGEVLDYVISPTGKVARPKMMSTLMHALLWFHEGCREPAVHMSIVKLAASLDALACGGKSKGILRLVNNCLGIEVDRKIQGNGSTLKQTIEDIYITGRSRTIHGTNDKLVYDWSDVRNLAEQFSRLCLIECLDWVAKHPDSDDPKKLSAR